MKYFNRLKRSKIMRVSLLLLFSIMILTACNNGGEGEKKITSKTIEIDGSSTVFPITEAVSEEFMLANPDVMVTVGLSGSGGGFKRFTAGETDISNASREIKAEEAQKAEENGIKYLEIPVAYDGITIVINPSNDWVDFLTLDELQKLWEPGSSVKKWSDIRPEWPEKEIQLYGPGTDSGTFDYFTEAVNGESGASRSDYTASEDDNMLVQGVAGNKYALGYFGYAYYAENSASLKAVAIEGGNAPVEPTMETINNGSYSPLSRPLFIYVSEKSLERTEIRNYVKFYLKNAPLLVKEAGYVPLPDDMYQENLSKL